jgi:hypothetical protein
VHRLVRVSLVAQAPPADANTLIKAASNLNNIKIDDLLYIHQGGHGMHWAKGARICAETLYLLTIATQFRLKNGVLLYLIGQQPRATNIGF